MRFDEFVCFEATIPELQATDRDGAITELIAALVSAGKIPSESAKDVTKAVIKRENEASTGMGKGVAVPHVKHAAVKNVHRRRRAEQQRASTSPPWMSNRSTR